MKKRRHDSYSSSSDDPSDSKARKKPSASRRRHKREPSPHPKKKKRKKIAHRRRKKLPLLSSKKRRGRGASVSPSTSRSCSTSSSSSSRSRSRTRTRRPDERGRSRGTIKRSRGIDRARSSSSRSTSREKRRSISFKRSGELEIKDENRVEIIQEYGDDFPSSRSNDSLDGAVRRNVCSDEGDGDRFENANAGREGSYDGVSSVPLRLKSMVVVPEIPAEHFKSMVVVPAEPAEPDDLEVLLRQKALENLRKFRRCNSLDAKSSLSDNDRIVRDDGFEKNTPGGAVERDSEMALDTKRAARSETWSVSFAKINRGARDSSPSPDSRANHGDNMSGAIVSVPRSREKKNGDQVDRLPAISASPKIDSSKSAPRSSTYHSNPVKYANQQRMGQEDSNENLLTHASARNEFNNKHETEEKNTGLAAAGPSTILESEPGHRNHDGKKGTNEDSELENKTMTVMRGGELVQVKYKVYIPKKAPSLARRQLKR